MNPTFAFLALTFAFLTPSVCVHAAPPEGRYVGVLKVTATVDAAHALTISTCARAVATVDSRGGLSITLAQIAGPLDLSTFRTTITADNQFVYQPPRPAAAPAPVAPVAGQNTVAQTAASSDAVKAVIVVPNFIYGGTVAPTDCGFRMVYTDLPLNVSYVVAPNSYTTFSYTFRRVP